MSKKNWLQNELSLVIILYCIAVAVPGMLERGGAACAAQPSPAGGLGAL